jgi:NAD(P)-dependent dehydrogenase (short-subunit alcohol dehydrogenase family)
VATARDVNTLKTLADTHGDAVLTLALDVTDKAAVDGALVAAHEHFGRLDVVVNNAGYGLFGAIEEVSEEQARAQIETNLFGALWVTKAALPILRAQGSGHIIQVSSIGGVQAFPTIGLYHASKWGLEAFSQSLAAEVAGFGINVTIVEPTGYSTDWSGPSAVRADPIAAYEPVHAQVGAMFAARRQGRGDPQATGPAILEIVDAEKPPLRVFFGDGPLEMIHAEYERRLALWDEWAELSVRAHGSKD